VLRYSGSKTDNLFESFKDGERHSLIRAANSNSDEEVQGAVLSHLLNTCIVRRTRPPEHALALDIATVLVANATFVTLNEGTFTEQLATVKSETCGKINALFSKSEEGGS